MYIKIVKSGKFYEIYKYEKAPLPPKIQKGRRKGTTARHLRSRPRTPDAIRRTKQNFLRIVRANLTGESSPAFLTLTMRDIVRIEYAYRCFSLFFSHVRRYFGKEVKFIAVPEFQTRGAVHFHILVWGLKDEVIENERANRTLQNLWSFGYVDCIPTDGSPKLAGYLAKYMHKSMQDYRLNGLKSYYTSGNIMRPVSQTSAGIFTLPEDFWSGDNEVLTEREFDTYWLGSCNYQLIQTKHET